MYRDKNLNKVFCYVTDEMLKILSDGLLSYYGIEAYLIGEELGRYECLKEMHLLIRNVLLDQSYSIDGSCSTVYTDAAFEELKGGI